MKEENWAKLSSSDPTERRDAFFKLWPLLEEDEEKDIHLKRYLYRLTENYQDAEDLLHEVFFKLYNHLENEPLSSKIVPAAYLYRTARNAFIDFVRERKRDKEAKKAWAQIQGVLSTPDVHEEERWLESQEVKALVLYLPDEWHRKLGVLRWWIGYTPDQIATVTGWDKKAVVKGLQECVNQLAAKYGDANRTLQTVSPWEQQLPQGFSGISIVNISPQHLASECEEELFDVLDVKNRNEFDQRYISLLRIHNLFSSEAQPMLTFMETNAMAQGIYEGKPIHYLDVTPVFSRITRPSSWQQVMALTKPVQYTGELVATHYMEQTIIQEWHMKEIGVRIQKSFNEQVASMALQPNKQKQFVGVYQICAPPKNNSHQALGPD